MKTLLSNRYLLFCSRFLVGIVFIIAGVEKIAYPELFALNINAYQIIPFQSLNILALIIPWLEVITGLFLISHVYVRSSSIIILTLLCIFILAIFIALLRGLKIDCGCFGPSSKTPIGMERIMEDIGLLLLTFHIFYFDSDKSGDLINSVPHRNQ